MPARVLIYGASGYTGRLVAVTAAERGLPAVVAGRSAGQVTRLAERLGLEGRTARVDEPERLDDTLHDVAVVLNVAGPFATTAAPLVDACLRTGTHYLDVAGELAVFHELQRRDAAARERGVMILPGAAINVVASDCLAAHLRRRLPMADEIAIGISRTTLVSRGSLRTVATVLSDQTAVCRDGRLVSLPVGTLEHEFDFGVGPTSSTAVSWPDVFTASLSTGAPNVTAFVQIDALQRLLLRSARGALWFWRTALGQALLKADVTMLGDGPSYADQKTRRRAIVVEARNRSGARACARLRTPEGYWFTTLAALAVVERVLAGDAHAGFQTPARAYGPELVEGLDGVYRDDLW